MQDKIQEIMGLVKEYGSHRAYDGSLDENSWDDHSISLRAQIEAKLRELVREPLSDEQAWEIARKSDNAMHAVRLAERAHGITNASEEALEIILSESQSIEYSAKHGFKLHRGELMILKGKSAQEWISSGNTSASGV